MAHAEAIADEQLRTLALIGRLRGLDGLVTRGRTRTTGRPGQIERLEREFLEQGGLRERMTRARLVSREKGGRRP